MGRRPRGEGSVYRRKDGSWVAQYQGQYRYARDEFTARQKLYKLLAGAEESKPANITVATNLDQYLQHAQTSLKPRTVKRYREAIETHLKPSFGKCKLHTLDAQQIERVYRSKLADGLSPASIHLLHAVLSASMTRAVRLKLVQHNVCRDVQKPRIEDNEEDVLVFKPEEVQAILEAARSEPLYALYALVFSTGLRISEALAIKRSDVDLQAGTLRIVRTVYNGAVGTPKSKRSRRTIALPKIAHDALERHLKHVDSGGEWLFATSAGTPYWYWTFVTRHYKPLLQRAGVEYKHIHTARHTVASNLLANRVPITSVARFMGHDVKTLLSTYSHLMPNEMTAVATAIDNLLE